MVKTKLILGVASLAALLSAAEFVRKPVEFTDTYRGYSVEKTDANYALKFDSNAVSSAISSGRNSVFDAKGKVITSWKYESNTPLDSNNNSMQIDSKYHVTGYENFWGKQAKTVERVN